MYARTRCNAKTPESCISQQQTKVHRLYVPPTGARGSRGGYFWPMIGAPPFPPARQTCPRPGRESRGGGTPFGREGVAGGTAQPSRKARATGLRRKGAKGPEPAPGVERQARREGGPTALPLTWVQGTVFPAKGTKDLGSYCFRSPSEEEKQKNWKSISYIFIFLISPTSTTR